MSLELASELIISEVSLFSMLFGSLIAPILGVRTWFLSRTEIWTDFITGFSEASSSIFDGENGGLIAVTIKLLLIELRAVGVYGI